MSFQKFRNSTKKKIYKNLFNISHSLFGSPLVLWELMHINAIFISLVHYGCGQKATKETFLQWPPRDHSKKTITNAPYPERSNPEVAILMVDSYVNGGVFLCCSLWASKYLEQQSGTVPPEKSSSKDPGFPATSQMFPFG